MIRSFGDKATALVFRGSLPRDDGPHEVEIVDYH